MLRSPSSQLFHSGAAGSRLWKTTSPVGQAIASWAKASVSGRSELTIADS